MRFEQGDEVYQGLVDTAVHELYIATENFKLFNRSLEITVNAEDNIFLDAMSYQHYSEFVRSLYEFYVAIIQWNEQNTRLRDYDFDGKMTEAVQRLLNFHGPLKRAIDRSLPVTVPEEFGYHFRHIRNRTAHADYRRMAPELGKNEITLAQFYSRYHFYCKLLLEHPQFTWGSTKFVKSYTWAPVREFMRVIRGGDS